MKKSLLVALLAMVSLLLVASPALADGSSLGEFAGGTDWEVIGGIVVGAIILGLMIYIWWTELYPN